MSILGLSQPGRCFDYSLAVGSFNDQRYLQFMESIVNQAAETFTETGQLTVVVLMARPTKV